MEIFSTVIFILIVVSIIATNTDVIRVHFIEFAGISLLLNILTMGIGFFSAKFFNLNLPQRISIAIESGVQNGTLAIVIATSILQQSDMSTPAAIYSLNMFLTGGFMMWYFGREKSDE